MTWAYAQPVPDAECKLLLLALANYAGHDHSCWPSIPRLAAECLLCEQTIKVRLKTLVDAGLISVQHRAKPNGEAATNIYTLKLPDGVGYPVAQGGLPRSPGGLSRSPEPIIEPINEPKSTHTNTRARTREEDQRVEENVKVLRYHCNALYRRKPGDAWHYEEEYRLVELARRGDPVAEFHELTAYRKVNAEFFPKSIHSLLLNWTKTLDEARNFKDTHKPAKDLAQINLEKALANERRIQANENHRPPRNVQNLRENSDLENRCRILVHRPRPVESNPNGDV